MNPTSEILERVNKKFLGTSRRSLYKTLSLPSERGHFILQLTRNYMQTVEQ